MKNLVQAAGRLDANEATLLREEGVDWLGFPLRLRAVCSAHPESKIITSSIEDGLTENTLMVPGTGNFGDRYFGTVVSAAQNRSAP